MMQEARRHVTNVLLGSVPIVAVVLFIIAVSYIVRVTPWSGHDVFVATVLAFVFLFMSWALGDAMKDAIAERRGS